MTTAPSIEGFEPINEKAKSWSEFVRSADAVVLVSLEYNHGLSDIQKNAIDWLYHEWTDKPVVFVAYGWYAGANTLTQPAEISTVLKWRPVEKSVGLQFTKDIDLEGNVLDGDTVDIVLENIVSIIK